jgi:uncharacterized membrane protein
MSSNVAYLTARIGAHPILDSDCLLVGALLTDLMYCRAAEMMWTDFSAWLVTVGVIVGWLAALAGLSDFLGNRAVRALPPAWPHVIGNAAILLQHTTFAL